MSRISPARGLAAPLLATAFAACALAGAQAAEKPLKVVIDVEGGAATLFITPEGKTLLVDAGWPKGMGVPRPPEGAPPGPPQPSSAERIVAKAKAAGVSRIDYLLITHYHVDHIGGIHDLLPMIPVGTLVDHGPNREELPAGANPGQAASAPATLFPKYAALSPPYKRRSVAVGQSLQVGSVKFTFVASDAQAIDKPLPGAGGRTAFCDITPDKAANGGEENVRSIGFVATYGKARIMDLGDLTWNREKALVCPVNKIGKIDLLLVSHHGSELSNSAPLLDAVSARVALMANGARKGGDKATFETLAATASKPAVWQSHFATRSPEANRPADYIANPDAWPDGGYSLTAEVGKDGAISVVNERNGFSQTYPKAR